jgi:PIN domain nuclease of toxin-antitoxin system
MIKSSIGKLAVNFDPIDIAKKSDFELLDYSAEDALALKELPFHHKDPFDRMLISQALNRKYVLMTDDAKMGKYDCRLV